VQVQYTLRCVGPLYTLYLYICMSFCDNTHKHNIVLPLEFITLIFCKYMRWIIWCFWPNEEGDYRGHFETVLTVRTSYILYQRIVLSESFFYSILYMCIKLHVVSPKDSVTRVFCFRIINTYTAGPLPFPSQNETLTCNPAQEFAKIYEKSIFKIKKIFNN